MEAAGRCPGGQTAGLPSGSARRPQGSFSSPSQAGWWAWGQRRNHSEALARRPPSWPCRCHVWGRHCSPGPTEPHSQACLRASLQGSRARVLPENSDTPKLHLKFRGPPSLPLMNLLKELSALGCCLYGAPVCAPLSMRRVHLHFLSTPLF